ncbi:MAG: hypothetical protein BWY73_01219 [candidate division TA06 bacterium ADurb.Bin417]|uniref:Uncharacterized protein n=1 Tax=candidate division TA06 bacterium ADurb.Bin417 TaxID=1852828 RepID=A0A1V5MCF7_UNCT6|nr:MAG: hypothetical protein BWY73_01219 [candidate division TA06 bacterium ADurb.Bin417]
MGGRRIPDLDPVVVGQFQIGAAGQGGRVGREVLAPHDLFRREVIEDQALGKAAGRGDQGDVHPAAPVNPVNVALGNPGHEGLVVKAVQFHLDSVSDLAVADDHQRPVTDGDRFGPAEEADLGHALRPGQPDEAAGPSKTLIINPHQRFGLHQFRAVKQFHFRTEIDAVVAEGNPDDLRIETARLPVDHVAGGGGHRNLDAIHGAGAAQVEDHSLGCVLQQPVVEGVLPDPGQDRVDVGLRAGIADTVDQNGPLVARLQPGTAQVGIVGGHGQLVRAAGPGLPVEGQVIGVDPPDRLAESPGHPDRGGAGRQLTALEDPAVVELPVKMHAAARPLEAELGGVGQPFPGRVVTAEFQDAAALLFGIGGHHLVGLGRPAGQEPGQHVSGLRTLDADRLGKKHGAG